MKFSQAIEKFTEWGTEDYQNRTLEVYVDHLRRFCKFIDDKEIEDINLFDDILQYRRSLKARGISDNTINLSMVALRQMWKIIAALEKQLDIELPFLWNVIPHKNGITARSHAPVSEEDFIKMLKAANLEKPFMQIRDAALISMFYDVGCRVSEMCELNRSSLHIDKLIPSAQFITRKRRDHLKMRELTWTRETQKLLLTYLDLLKGYKSCDALWITRRGNRLSIRSMQRIMKKYAQKAGLDPQTIKPHGFRHGVGMRCAEAEMHPVYIRDILGHTSITGSNVYIKVKNPKLHQTYHALIGDNKKVDTISESMVSSTYETDKLQTRSESQRVKREGVFL